MMKHDTPLLYVLTALVPYTKQNLLLTFKPSAFFNELERLSPHSSRALRNSYNSAVRQQLISPGNVPHLTLRGRSRLQPFVAKQLGDDARLMITFDIPESQRKSRDAFRRLLRYFECAQVQKSVWITDKDCSELIKENAAELGISDMVDLYEVLPLR